MTKNKTGIFLAIIATLIFSSPSEALALSKTKIKEQIKQEITILVQEHDKDQKTISEKISQIETRNRIKTFLLGSDYKNLGTLRSEMVKTRNNIDQLKRLVEETTEAEDKATLQNQIQPLEQEYTKITNFIEQNENKFSLFGWVRKLLNK